MRIGNTEFNVEAMSKMTREEFIRKFKGVLKYDINQAADTLDKYFKKETPKAELIIGDPETKPKRRRRKKS